VPTKDEHDATQSSLIYYLVKVFEVDM